MTHTTQYFRIDIDQHSNIDPANGFTLTPEERREMDFEARQAFTIHAEKFLAPHGLELLGNGEVIGPVDADWDQDLQDEFQTHIAYWTSESLQEKWGNIDASKVRLSIHWLDGTATLARDVEGEWVTVEQVDFVVTEDDESARENLADALAAADLAMEWDLRDEVEVGDVTMVTTYLYLFA